MRLTLEEAEQSFKNWRATRSYIGERIPDGLWDIVKELLPIHGVEVLRKTLGVSNTQLKRQGLLESQVKEQAYNNGFVMTSIAAPSLCELTVQKNDTVLTLKLSSSQLVHCLPLLVNAL